MHSLRPKLSKELHVDRFKDFYWLKEELQVFCREHGISATGSKLEISNRIETFLRTGEILKPVRKSRRKAEGVLSSQLSLETVITENHRCSQAVRDSLRRLFPIFISLLISKTILRRMLVIHIVM